MPDTKEEILFAALRLFARDGYEAVSVSAIAEQLGMTKGALYKHYKNKRDIFDSIFERIYQDDVLRAKNRGVPEEEFEKMPSAFKNTSLVNLKNYIEENFHIWLEHELTRNFRKMLTLEQYRNPEMGELYKKCVCQVDYIEDLFRDMIEQGILKKADPKLLALEFFAPYHFLLNLAMADKATDIKESSKLLTAHIDRFIEVNAANLK